MSDTSANTQLKTNTDLQGLGTAFGIQVLISFGVILVFSLILRPYHRVIYEPRSKFAPDSKKPLPLTKEPLSWIQTTRKVDILLAVDKIGLDAVMYLRFIKFCVHFFLCATVFAVPLCLFHYFIMPAPPKPTTRRSKAKVSYSLELLTISNIHFKVEEFGGDTDPNFYYWFYMYSSLLWMASLWCYYNLYVIWRQFTHLRRHWFKTAEFNNGHHNKTLLLSGVPDELKSEEKLQRHYEKLFEKESYGNFQLIVGRDSKKLTTLVTEHLKCTEKMEKTLIKFLKSSKGKRPTHSEDGQKVDSINFYSKKLNELEEQIYDLRVNGDKKLEQDSSAFISFDTILSCHKVAKKLEHPLNIGGVLDPSVKLCPNYDDVIWKNVGLSKSALRGRRFLTIAIFIAIALGWTGLVSFVTVLTQLDTIKTFSPQLALLINENKFFTIFFTSILGPLLLASLNLLLPIILRYLTVFQGVKTNEGVEKSVLRKYYFFLLYQFLLTTGVTTLLVTYFSSLNLNPQTGEQIVEKTNADGTTTTNGVFNTLLTPIASGFLKFSTTFIILASQSLTGYSIEIAQAVPLLSNMIKRRFFNLTPRQDYIWFTTVSICLFRLLFYRRSIYSTIRIIRCVYFMLEIYLSDKNIAAFSFTYSIMKYQILYVYETRVETGGTWWPKVSTLILIGLFLCQFTTAGVLSMKIWIENSGRSRGPVIMATIAPAATLLFWFYINRTFAVNTKFVSEDLSSYAAAFQKETENFNLEEEVFNPAFAKPLPKIWLPSSLENKVEQFHKLEYSSLEDYLKKKNPYMFDNQRNNANDSSSTLGSAFDVAKAHRLAAQAQRNDDFVRRETMKRMSALGNPIQLGGELRGYEADSLKYRQQYSSDNFGFSDYEGRPLMVEDRPESPHYMQSTGNMYPQPNNQEIGSQNVGHPQELSQSQMRYGQTQYTNQPQNPQPYYQNSRPSPQQQFQPHQSSALHYQRQPQLAGSVISTASHRSANSSHNPAGYQQSSQHHQRNFPQQRYPQSNHVKNNYNQG
ncbi:Transmembrane protein 63C [Clydaea vesicula]|uniref:Transmembrane protein 63C n=1 Tax=Clydaea vesicula TaxID=447962 RepID=A0AAD5UC03_9FUNG|nr:Transmembrane protein 63C [Clydaea vesicula]